MAHWQLSALTVVRSDSCSHWQLSDVTVVRSYRCPIWQLSANPKTVFEKPADSFQVGWYSLPNSLKLPEIHARQFWIFGLFIHLCRKGNGANNFVQIKILKVPGLVVLGGDDRIDGVTQKVTISYFSHTHNCLLLWSGWWGRWDQGWRSKRPLHFHTLPHIWTHLLLCHSGFISTKLGWKALCLPRSHVQSCQLGIIRGFLPCPFSVFQDEDKAVFTGDTLFLGGCGRFFEGTVSNPVYNFALVCNRTNICPLALFVLLT